MNIIYYFQTNIMCIAILILLRTRLFQKAERFSTTLIIFNRMIIATIVFCISDLAGWFFQGKIYPGTKAIIEISSIVYYEALVVIGYLWALFIVYKLRNNQDNDLKRKLITALPLIVFTAVAITNHFTHFLFSVNESNIYSRENGIFLHWLIAWIYLTFPTIQIACVLVREKSKVKRKEISPLLFFSVAPAVASIVQMLFYGVTSTQIGITFSIIMVCLTIQRNQVMTDELTGLNNRRNFEKRVEEHIQHPSDDLISIFIIDINHFKLVNDKFGHISGDRALCGTANALREACREITGSLFLCRYGGDEFVIVGFNQSCEQVENLKQLIHEKMASVKYDSRVDEPLDVSIGVATGTCKTPEEAEKLIRSSDDSMYQEKSKCKKANSYRL